MDQGKKPKGTFAPLPIAEPRKPGIGKPPFAPIQRTEPIKKRNWTSSQWEQSKQFAVKKEQKILRQENALDGRRVGVENAFLSKLPQARQAELSQLSDMKLVSRPKPMPTPGLGVIPVPPKLTATKNYKDVMSDIGSFLDPKASVRSKFNDGGPQMIQQFTNETGVKVTRRVGIDVEPSSHVQGLNPHLNLQTQHNGTIQDGVLADPHSPIRSVDPFVRAPIGPGQWRNLRPEQRSVHPLMGLTSDEKRGFAERYIHSLGIPIKRE